MSDIPRGRRFALAVCAVSVAGWLLRPALADALVARGDGYLYGSQTAAALREYWRANVVDDNSETAVDRFAFFAGTLHDPSLTEQAVRMATEFLARHPGDDTVRMDRAMALRRQRRVGEALSDFARVAHDTHEPGAATLAGYCAMAEGERRFAIEYFREALRERPDFPAALHELRRLSLVR